MKETSDNKGIDIDVLVNRFWIALGMVVACFGASLIHPGLIFILIGFYILAFVILTTPTSLFNINLYLANDEVYEQDDEQEADDTES